MLVLKSFDTTQVSPYVEIPRMEQIITDFPFVKNASFEDLYRFGGSDLKFFLSQVPLQHKHAYISVNMEVQLLFKGRTTAPRSNWHFDGLSFMEQDETNCHLFVSDCSARTEFLAEEIQLEHFTQQTPLTDVEIYMNKNLDRVKPKMMEPNRFVTFNELHFHRPVRAEKTEFRFMIRVLESNHVKPRPYEDALMRHTQVFDDQMHDYSKVDLRYILENKSDMFVSLQRDYPAKSMFTLNYMPKEMR